MGNIVGFKSIVPFYQHLTEETCGSYYVATNQKDFYKSIQRFTKPIKFKKQTQIGFAISKTLDNSKLLIDQWNLDFQNENLLNLILQKAYVSLCPRCHNKTKIRSNQCSRCRLLFITELKLQKIYQNISWIEKFEEIPSLDINGKTLNCFLCNKMLLASQQYSFLRCSFCFRHFCHKCHNYLMKFIHICPGCKVN